MTSQGSDGEAAYIRRHRMKLGGDYPAIEGDSNTTTQLLAAASQDPRVLIATADLQCDGDDESTLSTQSKISSRHRNLSFYQRTVNAFAKPLRRFIAYLTSEVQGWFIVFFHLFSTY